MGTWRQRLVISFVALLALNGVGMLRYPGGPLRDRTSDGMLWLDLRPADQGYFSVSSAPSAWSAVGRTIYVGALDLVNPWPWAATIEAITPLDPTATLSIDQVMVGKPGASSAGEIGTGSDPILPDGRLVKDLYLGLPAVIAPGTSPGAAVPILLVLHGVVAGTTGFTGLAFDYRVGPFTFRVVQHFKLALCLGPLAPGQECSSP